LALPFCLQRAMEQNLESVVPAASKESADTPAVQDEARRPKREAGAFRPAGPLRGVRELQAHGAREAGTRSSPRKVCWSSSPSQTPERAIASARAETTPRGRGRHREMIVRLFRATLKGRSEADGRGRAFDPNLPRRFAGGVSAGRTTSSWRDQRATWKGGARAAMSSFRAAAGRSAAH
jgi:hypothetical protein